MQRSFMFWSALIAATVGILIGVGLWLIVAAKNRPPQGEWRAASGDSNRQGEPAELDGPGAAALSRPAEQSPPAAPEDPRPLPGDQGEYSSVKETVDQLGFMKPPEADKAVAWLVRQRPAAVEEIGRQMVEQPLSLRLHYSTIVLQRVNSEQSRELLRQLALGKLRRADNPHTQNPHDEAWAAQALIKCDKRQAWVLLQSTTTEVLVPVLAAIDGQLLDEEKMKLLKSCLKHKDGVVRWRTAGVMVRGSEGELAKEAVGAIGEALTTIASQANANEPYPRAGGYTYLEMSALPYIRSLEEARVDNRDLRELAKRLRGRARDAVVVALAQRGDKSTHDEIVKLAHDPQAGDFRTWAVRSLEVIGTGSDLPRLRILARTDPLVRQEQSCLPPGKVGPTYPVREAARAAIAAIGK